MMNESYTQTFLTQCIEEIGRPELQAELPAMQKELETLIGQKILEQLAPEQSLDMLYNEDPTAYIRTFIPDLDELIASSCEAMRQKWIQKYSVPASPLS